jgi:hypothetical protein
MGDVVFMHIAAEAHGPGMSEDIATQALTFLAADRARTSMFLSATGLTAENIREAAKSATFLQGVLDYVCERELLLLDFASAADLSVQEVVMAQRALRTRNPKVDLWHAPKAQPRPLGPPIKVQCAACGSRKSFDRRVAQGMPATVAVIEISQCEKCGEADLCEARWLDGDGNELAIPA